LRIADEPCGLPMNKLPRQLAASRPLDIGAEADFALGGLSVRPSLREVSAGGRREVVEPRVMQVLVALVHADAEVVSRDRLIELCWGGRLVGDDAINSSIAKVRALAALTTPPAFEIETVPRVGYRLHPRVVTKPSHEPPPSPAVEKPSALAAKRHSLPWLWPAALGACALILVAAASWYFFKPDASRDWIVAESHQPFIGTSLIERYPAISPDGTMLAYSAGPNLTSRQIYLRLFKGDSSIQLTHEKFDATSPAWAPDGTAIAYIVFQDGHPCRIMEMEIPSGLSHQLGQCRSAERTDLTFDPSGDALIYADSLSAGTRTRLFRFDIARGKTVPLTDPPRNTLGDEPGAFSPDGRYLAYVRELGGLLSEVRLRRISDGQEHILDEFNGCDANPNWTPDGRAILISRDCLGSYSLWAYSLDGRSRQQVLVSATGIGRLSVNPDGYVAMETYGGHAPILAFKPGSNSSPTPLAAGSGLTSHCADFAPDGALAITGSMDSKFGVWIASSEGAPFRKIVSLPHFACAIRWSPDGSRFAFIQTGPAGFEIPVVSRDGEVITRIDYTATDTGLFDWTADGKSILSTRLEGDGWRIWRTDLATPDKSVPIAPSGWINPRVHGSMVFAQKYGGVGTWRLDTSTPQQVADGPPLEASDLMTISGDQLYYADLSDPKHPAIAMQSVYGGKKKRLMPLPFGSIQFTFAVNPKSGDLVFSPPAADNSDIGLVRLQRR